MKICVFTGTRAEYGILQPLIQRLRATNDVECKLLVTGTHLSPEFGLTVNKIEEQDSMERVEMLLSSDSAIGVAKSFGLGVIGFAEALDRIRPDWCVIAGDRYEALACATVCVMLSIPVAHLHGGEISEGSLDEYFRHAITKLSRLHLTSTEVSRQRVIQMGECPDTVFNVGALGLDQLNATNFLGREELEKSLGIKMLRRNLLVTYHSAHGHSLDEIEQELNAILEACDGLEDCFTVFTKSNADAAGRFINATIERYADHRPGRARLFDSLGSQRYFSLMRQVDAVVGNSSSGLLEAPSLGVPAVNIGSRQKGRIRARSVFDCDASTIATVLEHAITPEVRESLVNIVNPYGDGKATGRVITILQTMSLVGSVKHFYDLRTGGDGNHGRISH